MASEAQRELFRVLRESQSKYTYFLLAASGAAIGFALTQTQDDALAWTHLPLGVAVVLWGASFFCGCRHLGYVNSSLFSNAELLRVEAGMHPEVGNDPRMMHAASQGIRQALEGNSNTANRLGHLQFRFLISGAIFYVLWHVLLMALRAGLL